MYDHHLSDLLEQTKQLHEKAAAIDTKMENNEDGQLEELLALFEEREEAIANLAGFIVKEGFHWTVADREKIADLKKLDEALKPTITGLYLLFGKQLNRMNQTKQISKKYVGAYQNNDTGGSFIDKRK